MLTRLKEQYPRAVEEQKDPKAEFYTVSECLNVINVIVQAFPKYLSLCVN